MQNLGFTGTTVRVEFKLEQGGIGRPKTISKQDFLALIDYGMLIGKKKQAISTLIKNLSSSSPSKWLDPFVGKELDLSTKGQKSRR